MDSKGKEVVFKWLEGVLDHKPTEKCVGGVPVGSHKQAYERIKCRHYICIPRYNKRNPDGLCIFVHKGNELSGDNVGKKLCSDYEKCTDEKCAYLHVYESTNEEVGKKQGGRKAVDRQSSSCDHFKNPKSKGNVFETRNQKTTKPMVSNNTMAPPQWTPPAVRDIFSGSTFVPGPSPTGLWKK
jgi:hypothetical protein